MIRVGHKIQGKDYRFFTYPMCEYDHQGFADATKYLPVDFDLCLLECEKDDLKFNVYGWHTGSGWDGFRYNGEKVLRWKKKHSSEDIIQEYH